ncbi:MAG: tRNA lysidine(34) synthetase TilS [Moraxellaceae bacterium]|nr:MAG: tRNA lysidine(34) synthetase TilS [Moraxellaceae bacterium]
MPLTDVKSSCFLQLDRELGLLRQPQTRKGEAKPSALRLVVGYSGGLDSAVLLHIAAAYCKKNPEVGLEAVHIHHQLSPNADAWQSHCEAVCAQYGISFSAKKVAVEIKGKGVESAARDARYAVFSQVCDADGVLLLAHHLDDQAETFFLRLMRGSGPLGLSSMKTTSHYDQIPVLRPLLAVSRAELALFAAAEDITWVTDESNASSTYDRNYLRHEVLPLLRERWPAMTKNVSRSARLCHEAVCLSDELAEEDAARLLNDAGQLDVAGLNLLSSIRIRNLLRYSLRCLGISLPAEVVLQRVLDEVLPASPEAKPVVQWPGGEVRRYDGALYLLAPLTLKLPVDDRQRYVLSDLDEVEGLRDAMEEIDSYQLPWGGQVFVSANRECLMSLRSKEGARLQGLLFSALSAQEWQMLNIGVGKSKLVVQPFNRSSNPLKHWWQQQRTPYWFRQTQPLLYGGEALVLVPGLFSCISDKAPENGAEGRWVGWWPYSFESVVSAD